MKKLFIGASLITALCAFNFPPSDCSSLVFFKEGTSTTMTSYNDDGKVTASTKTLYSKVTKSGAAVSVTANQENYDKKGKLSTKSEFTISCSSGVLNFDLKMMMPSQQADSYKDFDMTIEGNGLEYPAELVVGSMMKDADVKFKCKTKEGNEMPLMNFSVKVTNRKIEAKESVTTPAGTFDCYKITENGEVKTLFTIKSKSTTWFSPEAGVVKTESYKENGKFVGKSELTELKK
jgi:hypothetical protein